MIEENTCHLDDTNKCPSARIIKSLFKRLDKLIESTNSESNPFSDSAPSVSEALKSVFDEYNYTVIVKKCLYFSCELVYVDAQIKYLSLLRTFSWSLSNLIPFTFHD